MAEPQLFDWPVTDKKERKVPVDPAHLVHRPPGWSLIANKNGPQGYHVIKSAGTLGTVVTLCGVVGRKISEDQRQIVLCPDCVAIRETALFP